MAVTPTPIFTQTPKIGFAKLGAANTNSDGTGNITTPNHVCLLHSGH